MSPPDPWLLCDPYCAQFKCYHEEEIEMNEEPPVTEAELARGAEGSIDAVADQSARIAELERRVEEAERERAKLNIAMSALESISVFEENMHGEGPAIEALAKIYKL